VGCFEFKGFSVACGNTMTETGGVVMRSSKKDFAQNTLRVVEISTGAPLKSKKNPAAVALGKLGGRVGGEARAEGSQGSD
jgi:hypothetical protein